MATRPLPRSRSARSSGTILHREVRRLVHRVGGIKGGRCPVNAYDKSPLTGLVLHDADLCIGCGYCAWNCPCGVPQLNPSGAWSASATCVATGWRMGARRTGKSRHQDRRRSLRRHVALRLKLRRGTPVALVPSGADGTHIGEEVDLQGIWIVAGQLKVGGGIGHIFPGGLVTYSQRPGSGRHPARQPRGASTGSPSQLLSSGLRAARRDLLLRRLPKPGPRRPGR